MIIRKDKHLAQKAALDYAENKSAARTCTKTMASSRHTQEEGQRVHWLASLGGLVAIAGLEDINPAILVAALTEINQRLREVSKERLEDLRTKGLDILQAREAEKRTFKSWQRANETVRFDFSREQQKQLIIKLGGRVPVLEKDIEMELRRLLRGVFA